MHTYFRLIDIVSVGHAILQVEHWRAGHSSSCKTQAPVPTNNSSNTLWPEMEIVLGEEERDEETGNTLPIVPANQSLALNAELQGFEEVCHLVPRLSYPEL